MKLVATKALKEHVKLAKPVINEFGQVLIQDQVPLTKKMIERLIELGVTFVYIEDENTKDIIMDSIVSDETRIKAIQTIKQEFTNMADEIRIKKSFNGEHLSKKVSKIILEIYEQIMNNKDALTILTDVFLHDSYIFSHSLNVTIYTLRLALEMNFTEKQIMEIGLGALLHDVGKMFVPWEILNKPGKLTDEEFAIIKKHTTDGYVLLKDLPNISLLVAHCALSHHERLDGSGYPRGLKGDEIHQYAQIIGICDVFDAVTTNRVYRKRAMLPHEGLELLYAGAGTLYCEEYVRAFRNTIAIYPVGLQVKLSDGRSGVVIKQNPQISTRPVIRILMENDQEVTPYDVDLVKEINVTIVECDLLG